MVTNEAGFSDIPLILPERKDNLLENKWMGAFLRSRWYPGVFQWPTLIVFGVIMVQLLLGPISAHDNFGTALTWVLWWPLIPSSSWAWAASGAPSARLPRSTTWCRSSSATTGRYPGS